MAGNSTTGFVGDSHMRRMYNLTDQDEQTFSHTSLYSIHFSKTKELKKCIQTHPQTNAILYSFGGNDLDSPFTNQDEHYTSTVAKSIIQILRDTFYFGVLPFIISIIPRTRSNHRVGALNFKAEKEFIEKRIVSELQNTLKYNPIINVDHLTALKHDGKHLTDFAYIEIMDTCRDYISKTISKRTQPDTNNNTWSTTAISTNSLFTQNTTTVTNSRTDTPASTATVTTASTTAVTTASTAAVVNTAVVTSTAAAAAVISTANTSTTTKRPRDDTEDQEWEEAMEVEHITAQVRNLLLRGTPTLRTMATQTDTAQADTARSPTRSTDTVGTQTASLIFDHRE